MGSNITLKAGDGHGFSAYRADPSGTPKAGLVVIQEIFGVNGHMRNVTDRFASQGYVAICPAILDRTQRDVELGYTPDDIEKAKALRANVTYDQALADIKACRDLLAGEGLKVGVVGYCWGGSLAWASACRLEGFDVAVSYYGGDVPNMADEKAKCPAQFHFGEKDQGIPLDKVAIVKQKQPNHPLFIYEGAGHGFSCDERGSFNEAASKLAGERTAEFLAKHL
ncbi:MAG: hypothetical protein RLZ98_718 [Pseudomonadota bacterium]|jgi:carboxymethylenebutenolidase